MSELECVHCGRVILGEPVLLPVSVDESVKELPAGVSMVPFCNKRCKRDWFDKLLERIDHPPYDPRSSIHSEGGSP